MIYRAGEIIILGDNMRNNNDDFFDFDEDIRKDLIEQGYKGEQLTSKFEKMKKRKILIGFGMNHE